MKKFRLYYDKDAEVKWLNRMAAEGWAMERFCLGVYTFSPCEPGQYRYETDLIDESKSSYEDYRRFMEDLDVTVVERWVRWVYLRKDADAGPFELYTDVESKIQQYKSIRKFFSLAMITSAICLAIEIAGVLDTHGDPMMVFFAVFVATLFAVLLRAYWRCGWKIQQLEEEREKL